MASNHSNYANEIIGKLSLEEKIALVSGHDFMFTNGISRLNIRPLRFSDGPHGLRIQQEGGDNGVSMSEPATCFPTAATTANSWNVELTKKMGEAISEECKDYGVDVLLGPGVNIKRNPLCGRNFEYFSEDPLLAGKLGAGEVEGLQKNGVGVSVKHFALNNSENYRYMSDSVADMRAMREIYLKPFEHIVKKTKPHTLMCAYNKINGTHCSENKWLLKDVLRDDWGFEGLVMTDWGAAKDRVEGIKAGNDLEMPGDTAICRKWLYDAVSSKELSVEDLDECVMNVLDLISKHPEKKTAESVDWEGHHELARSIAEESAVLLKNDGSLPLEKGKKLCIIGELFERMRYQGSGSSMINPRMLSTPRDVFAKSTDYTYFKGYRENELLPSKELIDEAVEGARDYETVLVFAGLTDYVESECGDRETMSLPENQLALIDALVKAGKKVVLVLFGGSPIELPFYDEVSSILDMYLPGQNGGQAVYDLLFGQACPSGKLAETWPMKYEDVPFGKDFSKERLEVYKESIYVGYRYYLTARKRVRFPFGYGLSYTSFEYSDLVVTDVGEQVFVSVKVRNTGKVAGKEIIQVYVEAPKGNVFRPLRELKGFGKLFLEPGEEQTATIQISKEDLRYWDMGQGRFVLEGGEYVFQIGKNSEDIVAEEKLNISGETFSQNYSEKVERAYMSPDIDEMTDEAFEEMSGLKIPVLPELRPITMESRFSDLNQTFMGRILYKAVLGVSRKDLKKAKKLPEGQERDNKIKGAMFLERALITNSLRSLSMSAGDRMPYNIASGFMDMSNGHLFRGIKDFMTRIKAPDLPEQKGDK